MSWHFLHFLSVAPYLQTHQVKLKTKLIYYKACKAAAFKETIVYQHTIMFYTRPYYDSVKDSNWDKHLLVIPTFNFWKRQDMNKHISQLERSNLAKRKQLRQSCIWTLCLVPPSLWTLVRKQSRIGSMLI